MAPGLHLGKDRIKHFGFRSKLLSPIQNLSVYRASWAFAEFINNSGSLINPQVVINSLSVPRVCTFSIEIWCGVRVDGNLRSHTPEILP